MVLDGFEHVHHTNVNMSSYLTRVTALLLHDCTWQAYAAHLLSQWLDRQLYWRAREASCSFADIAANAAFACTLSSAAYHDSVLTLITDGMDQAKFKVPRWNSLRVKALDKFPRPAIHVTGCWAHGHALQLAVSMPDVAKDSNSNLEVVSRCVDSVLVQRGYLPMHLHIQVDNTARENKNQKVFRWCLALVQRGVFRTISLAFLRKGHTHEDIDGLFGQIAVTIAHATFDTIDALIDILARKLRTIGADTRSVAQSLAYRLDTVADWESLSDPLGISFQAHGGPNAPHLFKFVRRADLRRETVDSDVLDDFADKDANDVFMLTRQYMSSKHWHQITAVLQSHVRAPHAQPVGDRPNKAKDPKLRQQIFTECSRAFDQNLISREGREFLEGWVSDELPKLPRPAEYKYLAHKWQKEDGGETARHVPVPYDGVTGCVNTVRIKYARPGPHDHAVAPGAAELSDHDDDLGEAEVLDVLPE